MSPSNPKTHSKKPAVSLTSAISTWFESQGWVPFAFQKKVWQAMGKGQWGLLHAGTGRGKTLATWFGALKRLEKLSPSHHKPGLKILWITPMRALAADTTTTLQNTAQTLLPDWRVEMRTGDTNAAQRTKQSKSLPDALVTTPESLSLLLTQKDAQSRLGNVQVVVVDEWHELIGSKRGVQLQLAVARLARWQPSLICWGMSATLGNLEQALETLCLVQTPEENVCLVSDTRQKTVQIDTLLPQNIDRFAWAGHLGLSLAPAVARVLQTSSSTLVFVNTRAQAERWYQALLEAAPDLAGDLALHHGSLDPEVRRWVEQSLKEGSLKAVVCTSSLDLGVDFLPVDRVLQIGSAKGVARLLQRAGRSGHAPGRVSHITLVPTNSLDILEAVAVQDAVKARAVESRHGPQAPIDVLVQHLVTIAIGGGFVATDLYEEVRSTHAYRTLTPEAWQWALDFVRHGGTALAAYPDYQRVRPDQEGKWRATNAAMVRRHRMSVGTIVSDAMMQVRYWSSRGGGARIGQVEESFVMRLKKGDCFLFAGRLLALVRTNEMTAYVKRATGSRGAVPRWVGGNMSLSSALAGAMLDRLDSHSKPDVSTSKCASSSRIANCAQTWQAIKPLLALQQQWSALPSASHLLVECWSSREGTHLFIYPFAGRTVHLGLSSLLAWRLAKQMPMTFSLSVNDYGFEMLCAQTLDVGALVTPALLSTDNLAQDLAESLNAGQLAQRRFREIARISGLVFQGYPGAKKTAKQVQASSGLFFDVFEQYDPKNQLLEQARREVLQHELDFEQLKTTLNRVGQLPLTLKMIERPTPFAFPLMVQRLRERLSSEKLSDRVARMVSELERAAQ
uniref:ligase-associated DNA damage response DEXH box helicase n=1 Tax=Orrella sp. TaxID=1921583 RepID=UPI004048E52F